MLYIKKSDTVFYTGARRGWEVAGSIPDGVTVIFHWHNPSCRTVGPGVDSASNGSEYQEYFLGG